LVNGFNINAESCSFISGFRGSHTFPGPSRATVETGKHSHRARMCVDVWKVG